jgi:hypothetical protein
MGKDKELKSFEFLFLTDDSFNPKKGKRLRNDVIFVEFADGTETCRMYLNNTEEYVDFSMDKVMLNELSKITWTKDTTRENGKFIKSDADEITLKAILQRYNESYVYEVYELKEDVVPSEKRKEKRKEFIKNNPFANTEWAYEIIR